MNLFSQNIRGEYVPIESKCKINLKINAKNSYTFSIAKNLKLKGKVKISKEDDIIYLDFGYIGSMYVDDTIYIRNSGNSINPYWHFEECDEKYLLFAKKTKKTAPKNKK